MHYSRNERFYWNHNEKLLDNKNYLSLLADIDRIKNRHDLNLKKLLEELFFLSKKMKKVLEHGNGMKNNYFVSIYVFLKNGNKNSKTNLDETVLKLCSDTQIISYAKGEIEIERIREKSDLSYCMLNKELENCCYLNNNLPIEVLYKDSQLDKIDWGGLSLDQKEREKFWPLKYKSICTMPICHCIPEKRKGKIKVNLNGFLSISCNKTYGFVCKEEIALIAGLAREMSSMFDIAKNINLENV